MSQYKYYLKERSDYSFKSNRVYINKERHEVANLHRAARKFQKK